MRDSGPILVPLDGSELAEGVLPYAGALARAFDAPLLLVAVHEHAERDLAETFPYVSGDLEEKAAEHARTFLERGRAALGPGLTVEVDVRAGEPGNEIIEAAHAAGARAIAIATHGRSGIGRWLYGSTASHVLRNAGVPVLAVGPHGLEAPHRDVTFGHVLVPLDGSALGDAALPVARTVATKLGSRVSLVRAVRWAVQSYPYSMPEAYVPQIDDELETAATAYLRGKQKELASVPNDAYVVRGAIAEGLLEFIDREAVDLVVMTTHARAGLARMALGSTAERLLQGSAPVLLLRPDGE